MAPDTDTRLQAEWIALNAIRGLVSFAARSTTEATYEEALAVGRELTPALLGENVSIIAQANEPPIVREMRQMAQALGQLQTREISPLSMVNDEIRRYELLLDAATERDRIRIRLDQLYRAKDFFTQRRFTESQILRRDVFTIFPPQLPHPPRDEGNVREYRLPYHRALRVRLLHPDQAEQATGADLLYEICSPKSERVRLVLVQYKLWDGTRLYFSRDRKLVPQMRRLRSSACRSGLCACDPAAPFPPNFRLPHCAAFVRPTDELQEASGRLISSGFHLPVCALNRVVERTRSGEKVLVKRNIEDRAPTHRVFEEMFSRGMLGSRWLSYREVEKFYREYKVFSPDERLVLHAQEFPNR